MDPRMFSKLFFCRIQSRLWENVLCTKLDGPCRIKIVVSARWVEEAEEVPRRP
jgi:hypothetical protein